MSITSSARETATQTGKLISTLLPPNPKKGRARKIGIFASPFLRACLTAEGIRKVLHSTHSVKHINVEEGFTEWLDPSLVSTSNYTPDLNDAEYEEVAINKEYESIGSATFPETVPELSARLLETVTSILLEYDDVIVISHAPCLLEIARAMKGSNETLEKSSLGGVWRFVIDPSLTPRMTHNSSTSHLSPPLNEGLQRWDFSPPPCLWFPNLTFSQMYLITLTALLPSLISPISDCDEVYNYYEVRNVETIDSESN